jgi:glutamine amidotransferase
LIAILDYGSGNLRSAERAFQKTTENVIVTSDSKLALDAEGLVVPGVGAFESCMLGLKKANGLEIIQTRIENSAPIFGICIGMQVLFESGTENGNHEGIGVLPGQVSKLPAKVLPHMGWNTVNIMGESKLFKGIENERFYFVHSYAVTKFNFEIQAISDYEGKFLAAVESGVISATQFHPEKSGAAGLKLIENWVVSL